MRLTEDTFLSRQIGPDYPPPPTASPNNHRQPTRSQAQTKEQYLYQLGHQGKKDYPYLLNMHHVNP